MRGQSTQYPQYGFARPKGYSTRGHMRALADHGPCPEHRLSFANVTGLVRGLAELPPGAELQLPPDDSELPPEERAEVLLSAGPGRWAADWPYGWAHPDRARRPGPARPARGERRG